MSMRHVTRKDLEIAYNYGLAGLHGMDSETAEDLGIPTSPESFASHVASAKELHAVQRLSSYICADCLAAAPCDHIAVDTNGKRHVIG